MSAPVSPRPPSAAGAAPGGPTLRVTGVPEHFNRPWLQAISSGAFARAGLNVSFAQCPGGTGAMVQSVLAGEVDVAVALTEGIVAAAVNQNAAAAGDASKQLRYCGQYVTSPLRWMIVTGAGRGLASLGDVSALLAPSEAAATEAAAEADGAAPPPRKIRVSISRLGSGSHLMAYLLATRQGWPSDRLEFTVDRDFRSMRRAVTEGTADVFMWEWFMTKPFVDAGELAVLGYIDTPWPCFGLAARAAWLAAPGNAGALRAAMAVVLAQAAAFVADEDASAQEICAAFGIAPDDARAWLASVTYATDAVVPRPMLHGVLSVLASVGVISLPPPPPAAEGAIAPPPSSAAVVPPPGYLEAHLVDTGACTLAGPDAPHPAAVAAPSAAGKPAPAAGGDAAAAAPAAPPRAALPAESGGTGYHPHSEEGDEEDEEAGHHHAMAAAAGGMARIRAPPAGAVSAAGSPAAAAAAASARGTPQRLEVDGARDLFTLPPPPALQAATAAPGGGSAAAGTPTAMATAAAAATAVAPAGRSRANSLGSTGSSSALSAALAAAAAAAVPDGGSGGGGGGGGSGAAVMRRGGAAMVSSLTKPQARGEGQWHLKSADSLPPTARPAEYDAWKASKAAALAAVTGHLQHYGGAVVADAHPQRAPSVPFRDASALVQQQQRVRAHQQQQQQREDAAAASAPTTAPPSPLPPPELGGGGGVALQLPSSLAPSLLTPTGGIIAVPHGPRPRRDSRMFATDGRWEGHLFDIG